MKKKLGYAGVLVAVLALGGLFTACENVQQVKIVPEKANALASVTAVKTDDSAYVIIKWDAAENVEYYSLYVQQEGKKTILSAYRFGTSMSAQNDDVYAKADGAATANTDIDKWSALADTSKGQSGKKYRFGVQTGDLDNNSSDIVWSDYVPF